MAKENVWEKVGHCRLRLAFLRPKVLVLAMSVVCLAKMVALGMLLGLNRVEYASTRPRPDLGK